MRQGTFHIGANIDVKKVLCLLVIGAFLFAAPQVKATPVASLTTNQSVYQLSDSITILEDPDKKLSIR